MGNATTGALAITGRSETEDGRSGTEPGSSDSRPRVRRRLCSAHQATRFQQGEYVRLHVYSAHKPALQAFERGYWEPTGVVLSNTINMDKREGSIIIGHRLKQWLVPWRYFANGLVYRMTEEGNA